MEKEERIKRLRHLFETPENQLIPKEYKDFHALHKKIVELMNRDVWTHEFAFPELLYEEIRSGKVGEAFGKSLVEATKLTKSKKALIIAPSETEGIPLGFKVIGKLDLSKRREEKKEG